VGDGTNPLQPEQSHQTITISGYAKFPYNTKLSKVPCKVFRKMSLYMGDKCTPSSDYMDGHNNLRSGYLIYPLPPKFLAIVAAKLSNLFFNVALPCYCWNISIYFWIVFATILSWCTATTYWFYLTEYCDLNSANHLTEFDLHRSRRNGQLTY
jgi:hypothetical protein